jgi:ADP-ribose pyrophosphatase
MYLGRANLDYVGGVHGLRDEDEDIRANVISAHSAFEMVASGVIASAMPIIALQWLQLNHELVRELWR